MAAKYTIELKESFSAAHFLRGHPCRCANMHGHTYVVTAEVTATELDDLGLGLDSAEIKQVLRGLCEHFDHKCMNDLPLFRDMNPSAENVARWFYQQMQEAFVQYDHVQVTAIHLRETDKFAVRYSED